MIQAAIQVHTGPTTVMPSQMLIWPAEKEAAHCLLQVSRQADWVHVHLSSCHGEKCGDKHAPAVFAG